MARKRPALGTGLRYILTVLLGMTLSMVIAFVAVRTLTRGTGFTTEINTRQLAAAWALRSCANELTRLSNALVDAVPKSSTALPLATRTWLAEKFQSEIDDLRRELGAAELKDFTQARTLMDACARLASLALHPADPGLRNAALNEIRSAVDAANAFIRDNALERRVALPITPLRAD